MKALALLPILAAACGSDPNHPVDAPPAHHDAAVDSAPDSRPPDAAPTVAVGTVEVSQGTSNGSAASGATAQFGSGGMFGPVVGTDGPCTVYSFSGTSDQFSAGPITITGTASTITLNPTGAAPNVHYSPTATVPKPAFTAGATINFSAAGGPDVGAFTGSVTAPAALAGYTPPTTISRAGYTATWTAGAGPTIWVIVAAIDPQSGNGNGVVCNVNDTGSFTVPSTTFAKISAAYTTGFAAVGRVAPMTKSVGGVMVTVQATSYVTSGQITITN